MKLKNSDEQKEWEYWSKKRSFTLMEGMMLELGVLPPRQPDAPNAKQKLAVEFLIVCSDHLELMYSSLRVDKEHGKEWEAVTEEEAVSKVISRELFDKHWKECKLPRRNKFPKDKSGEDLKPKERTSLLKLIIGMAVDKYNYKPNKPSPALNIKSSLERAGLTIDEATILKFLREGKELLPDFDK